jgi:hypothetical protein
MKRLLIIFIAAVALTLMAQTPEPPFNRPNPPFGPFSPVAGLYYNFFPSIHNNMRYYYLPVVVKR